MKAQEFPVDFVTDKTVQLKPRVQTCSMEYREYYVKKL